uniref:Uncharacterized protein n=1 Tax=Sipha flava TaxID=143950 RepID=A0A2S2QDS6_9HEMI
MCTDVRSICVLSDQLQWTFRGNERPGRHNTKTTSCATYTLLSRVYYVCNVCTVPCRVRRQTKREPDNYYHRNNYNNGTVEQRTSTRFAAHYIVQLTVGRKHVGVV